MFNKELSQKKENKNSRKATTALAIALAGTLAVGGVMAYFTDADTTTNAFTVGKVSIALTEDKWDENLAVNITPGTVLDKNPTITNDGINDAYIFATVTVPYKNIVCADEDGTRLAAADTELFSYNVNDGWVELSDYMDKDTENGTVTHLYAYAANDAMTTVKANDAATVFDAVRFCNVIEDEGLEKAELNIVVNGYAIQTDNIDALTGSVDDDTNSDGTVVPAEVWDILIQQNPSLDAV